MTDVTTETPDTTSDPVTTTTVAKSLGGGFDYAFALEGEKLTLTIDQDLSVLIGKLKAKYPTGFTAKVIAFLDNALKKVKV